MRLGLPVACAFLTIAPAVAACSSSSSTQTTLQGVVVDAQTRAPLAGAVVAVEKGGLYLPIADYSKANPAYAFGAVAGADGQFQIVLPSGVSGLHAFANDHLYRGRRFDSSTDTGLITLSVEPRAAQIAKPTIANAVLDPATAAPGASIAVRADVHAGDPQAPLSDEVIVVEPTQSFAVAMAPPSAGTDRDHYPDGTYATSIKAPAAAGTYSYWIVATTGGCTNADAVTLQLVVR